MEKQNKRTFHTALFDLDGVILDTESQYTQFWGQMGREYRPDVPDFCNRIKGQTLRQIYDQWIQDPVTQNEITRRLNDFEARMKYPYIKGTRAYVSELHHRGVPTAIVTSSNRPKMENVYRTHPELQQLFTCILTSEDFTESKPSPQCYLRAAERLGVDIRECVVFEDSPNGLRSGQASGAYVVGLATTCPRQVIAPLCHEVVDNLSELL